MRIPGIQDAAGGIAGRCLSFDLLIISGGSNSRLFHFHTDHGAAPTP
jgi:hypothetical protein